MNTTLDALAQRTIAQLAADYRQHSRAYRKAGGYDDGDPDDPNTAIAWEARVRLYATWRHLRYDRDRPVLADALREVHWGLAMIDACRHDAALGEGPSPDELAREVAELRRYRAIVQVELAKS